MIKIHILTQISYQSLWPIWVKMEHLYFHGEHLHEQYLPYPTLSNPKYVESDNPLHQVVHLMFSNCL